MASSRFLLFILSSLTALPLLTSGCAPKIQAVDDLNGIQSTFDQFKIAVRNRKGDAAAELVTENSVERFDELRSWAVSDSPERLSERPVLDQIEILRLRHELTPEQLQNSDGKQVIALLVERGELPTPFVQDSQIAEPVFHGDRCILRIFDDSGLAKERMTFRKEDDIWKLDIASMEYVQEKIYNAMKRKRNMSDEEIIEEISATWDDDIDIDTLNDTTDQTVHPDQPEAVLQSETEQDSQ
ncbi:hypothetical protein KOR42_32610 [Thalassoglobus neptunius]|uniref:DUF3828 domain-containing protein n=1 Tax=Thalassoglobus neptunius TaxID=1938619 RepID=A0A5C5WMX3_9PLAN|nr:hypothetical protein [Thalassoglobus neptunius]TWT51978.1 hypothetical protein KOR42_32610 [Thalassoglobus neptunius]